MTQRVYFALIFLSCIISGLAVIPIEHTISSTAGAIPLELTPLIIALIALQNIIIFGLTVFFGAKFAQKIGIHFLLLDTHPNFAKDLLKPGLIIGLGCTLLQIAVDRLLPQDALTLHTLIANTNPLYGFIGSFYAIGQEVLMRLFLLSAIALVLHKIFKGSQKSVIMWTSILIASIIFGLAHIPTYINSSLPATSLLVFRVIFLNVISGVGFGYLFWRNSFEAAVFAHFINDILLYVILPLLLTW